MNCLSGWKWHFMKTWKLKNKLSLGSSRDTFHLLLLFGVFLHTPEYYCTLFQCSRLFLLHVNFMHTKEEKLVAVAVNANLHSPMIINKSVIDAKTINTVIKLLSLGWYRQSHPIIIIIIVQPQRSLSEKHRCQPQWLTAAIVKTLQNF